MQVTWILQDGSHVSAEVPAGHNLMEAALGANIAGVVGECGGSLSCATCHVQVDPAWQGLSGSCGDFEDAMLDATEALRGPGSRLSCQIVMCAELDGIVLHVPAA